MKDGLTIYSQNAQHDEVFIVGTPDSLRALRDALDVALTGDAVGVTPDVFNSDGEGYKVYVAALSETSMAGLRTPYTAEYAQESPAATRLWPTAFPRIRKAVEAEG